MQTLEKLQNGWSKNNTFALFLFKNINEDWLKNKLHKDGRTILEQFEHIIKMRLMWSTKINNNIGFITQLKSSNKNAINSQLKISASRVAETFNVLNKKNKNGYLEFDVVTLFTRLIAHEAHHRSQIIAIIKTNNLPISKSVNYGLWAWSHNFNRT